MGTAIISGAVALVGSILTFIVSMKQIQNKQQTAQAEQLATLKKELTEKLDEHRTEYLKGIDEVKESLKSSDDKISDLKGSYQTSIATINLSLSNLTAQVEKHNSVIERTFLLEKDVAVLKNELGKK